MADCKHFADLEYEAKQMHSCVDKQYRKCLSGSYFLFSVRCPDGTPSSTFALQRTREGDTMTEYQLVEHRGLKNEQPSDLDTGILLSWIAALGSYLKTGIGFHLSDRLILRIHKPSKKNQRYDKP